MNNLIPSLDHAHGLRHDSDQMVILDENANALEIGNGVLEAVNIIKTSPRLVGRPKGYLLATKYKGWKTFSFKNSLVRILVHEDYSYEAYPLECSTANGIYEIVGDKVVMPPDILPEELGQDILKCFKFFSVQKGCPGYTPYPPKNVELLDGSTLTITPPKDKHFADDDDCSAAEIYQCYNYFPQEDAESSAEFFIGIAPELDCNLHPENIQHAWEELYGKADYFEQKEQEHGIFNLRVEMKNKKSHRISYLLQMEEDLILECAMDVHQPNRRKAGDYNGHRPFYYFSVVDSHMFTFQAPSAYSTSYCLAISSI